MPAGTIFSEFRKILVPEVHRVECEREEEAVQRDCAARGVATHERGEALAVAPRVAALVAQVGGGGKRLQDLAAEADEQEEHDDDGGEGLVELQLHVQEPVAFNKSR